MLSLLVPGALAALAALAVPPLLHLRRRSEPNLVHFAALRWLGRGAQPRRQVRLQQLLLLFLRLGLLASLTVLLAQPVWRAPAAPGPPWVVLMPGLDPAAARAAAVLPAAEWHWLAPAFPPVGASSQPPASGDAFASLLRQLDTQLPAGTALQVLVPEELSGLDAGLLQLRRPVQWLVLPGPTAQQQAQPRAGPLDLALRYDAQHGGGIALVRALAAAWCSTGLTVSLDEAQSTLPPPKADALFWLGADLPPALRDWARAGGTVIAAAAPQAPANGADDESALPALVPLGQGRLLLFSALDPAINPALRNADLPTRLLALLRRSPAPPDRAPAASVAPVVAEPETRALGLMTPLDAYVTLLAALLFLAERICSLRARVKQA
jgi:hypothetical protein